MKKEKGSITLYVLIACIFFVIILSIVYTNVVHKKQAQEENIAQIQANYAKNLSQLDESSDLSSVIAELNSLNNRVTALESKKECNCDNTSIIQEINTLKSEVATLKTANDDKTTKINELTTQLTSAQNAITKLNTTLDVTSTMTCGEFLNKAFDGQKVYFSWASPIPSYGSGIIIRVSSWKIVNVIVVDDDSKKTVLYSINCKNENSLVIDCVTVTELN